jgi:putative addiction module component (TIGR02574 family)
MTDEMKDLHRVLELALKLPPEARAALAGSLLDSLDGLVVDDDARSAWEAEVARRARELDSGSVRAVPWADVRRRLSRS